MPKYQSIYIANTNIVKSTCGTWNNCSWSIGDIFHFPSQSPSINCGKFLAKILLHFLLSFDNNLTFFCLQKLFTQKFVSAHVFSIFLLSFRKIMFKKLYRLLKKVLLVLLTIFYTFDSKFISFVSSFVPTWIIIDSGFLSSTSSIFVKMSLLVAPAKFSTSVTIITIIIVIIIIVIIIIIIYWVCLIHISSILFGVCLFVLYQFSFK